MRVVVPPDYNGILSESPCVYVCEKVRLPSQAFEVQGNFFSGSMVVSFLICRGVTSYFCLNTRSKWVNVLNPDTWHISVTGRSDARSNALANFKRISCK